MNGAYDIRSSKADWQGWTKSWPKCSGVTTVSMMSPDSDHLPYERLMMARPMLLWALERSWTAEQAAEKGFELESKENSAWLVIEGRARVEHGGRQYAAGSGQWMFPAPGKRRQMFEGPLHFISVTIRWQWPDGCHLFDQGLTRVADAADIPNLEETARDICARVRNPSSSQSYYLGYQKMTMEDSLQLQACACQWSAAFYLAMKHLGVSPNLGTHRDPRVETILVSLKEMSNSPTVDREVLTRLCGVTARQMDRMLKAATGLTLAENHDAFRFESATQGLIEQGLRIKEVASLVGFTDLSAFSRWFTRRAGCSPRAFRGQFG